MKILHIQYIQTYQLVWGYNIVLNYSSVYFYLYDALAIWLCMFNLLSIDFRWHFPLTHSFFQSYFDMIFQIDMKFICFVACILVKHANWRSPCVFWFKKNGNETDCLFNLYFAQEKERCMHIAWKMCSVNGKFIFIKDFPLNSMTKRTAYEKKTKQQRSNCFNSI